MDVALLDVLRCPFCGTALSIVENDALVLSGSQLTEGVLGCECCAYPVVGGIPVMIADEDTRLAMHALEDGRRDEALYRLLGLADDPARQQQFRALMARDTATYREALAILCEDAEGTYFLYRFSDPTHLTTEALLHAIAQRDWPVQGRTLDLCGGSGHLTRVLATLGPPGGTEGPSPVIADVYFWKLWLASRFTAPVASPVCCDANLPLPFARDTFSTVVLADAYPYIWHKRQLAEEMMRLVGRDGVVVMPHLHSALGENFSAGDTLTPAAYKALFAPAGARLFSDRRMRDDVIERGVIDLTESVSPEELGDEPELTLLATPRADLFRRYEVPEAYEVTGELAVNPLYRVERSGGASILTLTFPTPEYEEEFGECRRYLPDRVTVEGDLTGPVARADLGSQYEELRDRHVLLDVPVGYY